MIFEHRYNIEKMKKILRFSGFSLPDPGCRPRGMHPSRAVEIGVLVVRPSASESAPQLAQEPIDLALPEGSTLTIT